jgi:hypothetical protein
MPKNYECLRRIIGICGSSCLANDDNLHCPNYYPCHRVSMGSEVMTYLPSQARAIQSELLAKLEATRRSAQIPATDSVAD